MTTPTPTPTHLTTTSTMPDPPTDLSPREREIVALIAAGATNGDIAEGLFLSVNTVKTHIKSVYRKIGVTRRSQAVVWGLTHGQHPDELRSVG